MLRADLRILDHSPSTLMVYGLYPLQCFCLHRFSNVFFNLLYGSTNLKKKKNFNRSEPEF